jgi:hypothetical protein
VLGVLLYVSIVVVLTPHLIIRLLIPIFDGSPRFDSSARYLSPRRACVRLDTNVVTQRANDLHQNGPHREGFRPTLGCFSLDGDRLNRPIEIVGLRVATKAGRGQSGTDCASWKRPDKAAGRNRSVAQIEDSSLIVDMRSIPSNLARTTLTAGERTREPNGYLGTWVPGYLGTWVLGYLGTWVLGYLGTWVLGYLGTWVLGYLGTWGLYVKDYDMYYM